MYLYILDAHLIAYKAPTWSPHAEACLRMPQAHFFTISLEQGISQENFPRGNYRP